jgi:[pyruvate, water dikinase]-phosphate phosphotransferase / [pyruvate, water dikinase] kinase
MTAIYTVFIISDGTGITAEKFATSLLLQFDFEYQIIRVPFVDDIDKAHAAYQQICQHILQSSDQAKNTLVFTSLVHESFTQIIHQVTEKNIWVLDLFQDLMSSLELKLGRRAKKTINQSHSMRDLGQYEARIDAIDYALKHDDGQSHQHLNQADVILIGVSRTGKTPTSLYLAMQYGLKAANYPLIPEDFLRQTIPRVLLDNRHKLYGLSIEPQRLASIRGQRRPHSHYACIENCLYEVEQAILIFRRFDIPFISSTDQSIEEIAINILQKLAIKNPLE